MCVCVCVCVWWGGGGAGAAALLTLFKCQFSGKNHPISGRGIPFSGSSSTFVFFASQLCPLTVTIRLHTNRKYYYDHRKQLFYRSAHITMPDPHVNKLCGAEKKILGQAPPPPYTLA